MRFEDLMQLSVRVFEAGGILVLVLGGLAAFVTAAGNVRRGAPARPAVKCQTVRVAPHE